MNQRLTECYYTINLHASHFYLSVKRGTDDLRSGALIRHSTRPDQGFPPCLQINMTLLPNSFASSKLFITREHSRTHWLGCQPAPIFLAIAGTSDSWDRGNDSIQNRMSQGTGRPWSLLPGQGFSISESNGLYYFPSSILWKTFVWI